MKTIGKAYQSQPLKDEGGGVYVGKIDPPAKGWTAFFVELTFDVGQSFPLKAVHGGANPARHVALRRPRPGQSRRSKDALRVSEWRDIESSLPSQVAQDSALRGDGR